jgi:hypothetical protein
MRERKYWVRREECWGGMWVYFVAQQDPKTYRGVNVKGPFSAERTAERMRDKMEADWNRYSAAMASKEIA